MDSSQDRNLPATPKKLQQARKDGNVPRSKDLGNLVVVGAGLLMVWQWGAQAIEVLRLGMVQMFRFTPAQLREPEQQLEQLVLGMETALWVFLPLGLGVAAAVIAAMLATKQFAYSTKPLAFDLNKINPLSGFGRIFSKQQAVEVLKLTAIMVLLGLVGGYFLKVHMLDFVGLLASSMDSGLYQLKGWFVTGVGGLLAVLLLISLIDVPVQQLMYKNRLKMSFQEVKEENKQSEGNPQLKGRMRQMARQMAQSNSVQRVPQADLVVMNPTHYAVALKYDETTMAAPQVIAKGVDLVALRIRDTAKAAQVPVLESPMLARALYAHTELDQQVPGALFTAVAQVLAYVYQLKAALKGQGPMPTPPQPDVPVELDPHHKPAAA